MEPSLLKTVRKGGEALVELADSLEIKPAKRAAPAGKPNGSDAIKTIVQAAQNVPANALNDDAISAELARAS